jgi:hypothetical protein
MKLCITECDTYCIMIMNDKLEDMSEERVMLLSWHLSGRSDISQLG